MERRLTPAMIMPYYNNNNNINNNNNKTEEREQKWSNKKIYGQFCKETYNDIDHEIDHWLKKTHFKAETEALIFAAQE